MKLKKGVKVDDHGHDEEGDEDSSPDSGGGVILPRDEELRLLGLYGEKVLLNLRIKNITSG